jgi:hypothetical protein
MNVQEGMQVAVQILYAKKKKEKLSSRQKETPINQTS